MAEKDKVYKYLNPVGIQEPVEMHPLAPRLDTLEGKNITMSVGAGGFRRDFRRSTGTSATPPPT